MAVSKAIVFVRSLGQIKRKCVKAEILLCAAVDTAGHQPALEACAVGRSGSVLKSDGAAAGISALNYMASDVCVCGFHLTQLCNSLVLHCTWTWCFGTGITKRGQ